MEFDYRELKRIIKNSQFKNCKTFAKAIGHTSTSLSYKFNGKRRFSQDDMLIICKTLGIDYSEIGKLFFCVKQEPVLSVDVRISAFKQVA